MIDLLKNITRYDTRHRTVSGTIIFALRSWQAYRFLEPQSEMKFWLQRANHAVIGASRRNSVHIRLYVLAIFLAIESGNYDSANEMLDRAMGYKGFLKANEPLYYGALCFLYAYLELNQKRVRSAKKYRRALSDHVKTAPESPHYAVMQGLLHLAAQEFPEAYKLFTEALSAGAGSIFLYEGLYRYYKLSDAGIEGLNILPVLIYAAERGADISEVAARYASTLSAAIAKDPEGGERLYAASGFPPILRDICAHRIRRGDMSAEAFALYRDAEKKQIYTTELFGALIRASYENRTQKINHYPIKNFLATISPEGIPDDEPGFAVYVYHFLLTDAALYDLLPDAQNKILQLGARCLAAGVTGREANSIYYYLWSRYRALGISGAELLMAEEILRENLTLFEVRTQENSAVRFIYITEPEKRGMEVLEISEAETPTVELVSENAAYTCLGAGQKTIIDEEVAITPMITQAGVDLYLHFFHKGDRRFHLLAYLANYYLAQEAPPDEAASVFEAMLAEKKITKAFKMRILIALGRLHYNAFSFDEAMQCYSEVDEGAIGDDFIPQLLGIYLQTREYSRAAKLISSKHAGIYDKILFEAVTTIISKSPEDTNEKISEIGYNLLMKNFFSEELLAHVLANYDASYTEWARLSEVIYEDNREAIALDSRVLENALAMACFDTHAQKAFTRVYAAEKTNPLVAEFAELATYEMLAKSTRPSYDVLNILEKIYLADEPNVLLAWALASVYLKYSITTFKSEEIIAAASATLESEGILLPAFKENRPHATPFTEKFQPFLYKGLPNKDCWLYYRIDNDSSFTALPMQYMKYGLYVAAVPMFFGETFTYYFCEEMPTGSITTQENTVKNTREFIHESPDDPYFTINNAIIYEQRYKHDMVEKLISALVKDAVPVRAELL